MSFEEHEIDIEEHDVLDNPAVKSIFPDLSVVKTEIEDYSEYIETQDEDFEPETSEETYPPEYEEINQDSSQIDDEFSQNFHQFSVDPNDHILIQNYHQIIPSNAEVFKPQVPINNSPNPNIVLKVGASFDQHSNEVTTNFKSLRNSLSLKSTGNEPYLTLDGNTLLKPSRSLPNLKSCGTRSPVKSVGNSSRDMTISTPSTSVVNLVAQMPKLAPKPWSCTVKPGQMISILHSEKGQTKDCSKAKETTVLADSNLLIKSSGNSVLMPDFKSPGNLVLKQYGNTVLETHSNNFLIQADGKLQDLNTDDNPSALKSTGNLPHLTLDGGKLLNPGSMPPPVEPATNIPEKTNEKNSTPLDSQYLNREHALFKPSSNLKPKWKTRLNKTVINPFCNVIYDETIRLRKRFKKRKPKPLTLPVAPPLSNSEQKIAKNPLLKSLLMFGPSSQVQQEIQTVANLLPQQNQQKQQMPKKNLSLKLKKGPNILRPQDSKQQFSQEKNTQHNLKPLPNLQKRPSQEKLPTQQLLPENLLQEKLFQERLLQEKLLQKKLHLQKLLQEKRQQQIEKIENLQTKNVAVEMKTLSIERIDNSEQSEQDIMLENDRSGILQHESSDLDNSEPSEQDITLENDQSGILQHESSDLDMQEILESDRAEISNFKQELSDTDHEVISYSEHDIIDNLHNEELTIEQRDTPNMPKASGHKPNTEHISEENSLDIERRNISTIEHENIINTPQTSQQKGVLEQRIISGNEQERILNIKLRKNLAEQENNSTLQLESVPADSTTDLDADIVEIKTEPVEWEAKIYTSYISLCNIGPLLQTSTSYCRVCQTLFPSHDVLEDHQTIYHSQVAMESSVCDEPLSQTQNSESSLYCVKSFKTIDLSQDFSGRKLIQISSRMQDRRCPICFNVFSRRENLLRHFVNLHKEYPYEDYFTGVLPNSVKKYLLEKSSGLNEGIPIKSIKNSENVGESSSSCLSKSQIPTAKTIEKPNNLCQLCNRILPNQEDLITHLYEHFSENKNTKKTVNTPKQSDNVQLVGNTIKKRKLSQESTETPAKKMNTQILTETRSNKRKFGEISETVSSQNDLEQNAETYYQCPYCSKRYVRSFFIRHMKIVHNITYDDFNDNDINCDGDPEKHDPDVQNDIYDSQFKEFVVDSDSITYCHVCKLETNTPSEYNVHVNHRHLSYGCERCKLESQYGIVWCPHKPVENINDDSKRDVKAYKVDSDDGHNDSDNNKNRKMQPFLQCDQCFMYFVTESFFLAHMNAEHDAQIQTVPENCLVTNLSLQCRVCLTGFSNYNSYNIHLRTHNTSKCQFCKKRFTHSAIEKHKLSCQHFYLFECKFCLKYFANRSNLYKHKKSIHPKLKPDNTFCRKLSLKDSDEYKLFTLRYVCFNILFRCQDCNTYFINSFDANNHKTDDECNLKHLPQYQCGICDKNIVSISKKYHEIQHANSENIQAINMNAYLLNDINFMHKCAKCEIHFQKLFQFQRHVCLRNNTPYKQCSVCELNIQKEFLQSHEMLHDKQLQFTVMEYHYITQDLLEGRCDENPEFEDNNLEENDSYDKPEEAKINKEKNPKKATFKTNKIKIMPRLRKTYTKSELTLYRCHKCQINTVRKWILQHERSCKRIKKQNCHECGLTFSPKGLLGHLKIHRQSSKKITSKDFTFFNFNGRKIVMSLSLFLKGLHKCKQCNAVSVTSICSHESVECEYCKIKLTQDVYKLHMLFHNEHAKSSDEDTDTQSQQEESDVEQSDKEEDETVNDVSSKRSKQRIRYFENDDLEMEADVENKTQEAELESNDKYEDEDETNSEKGEGASKSEVKINSEEKENVSEDKLVSALEGSKHRNILFQCVLCLVTLDDYEKTIAHCELHKTFGDITNYLPLNKCFSCNLTFDKNSYLYHRNLHKSKQFRRNQFRIVHFDIKLYKTTTWSKEIMRQVNILIDDSDINITLIRDSTAKKSFKIYQCLECLGVVKSVSSAKRHIKNANCQSIVKRICPYCKLHISAKGSFKSHMLMYGKHNVNCFKIYGFSTFEDAKKLKKSSKKEETNKEVIKTERIIEDVKSNKNAGSLKTVLVKDGPENKTIYECALCRNTFRIERKAITHLKLHHLGRFQRAESSLLKCEICGLDISFRSYKSHIVKYHGKNSKQNCRILRFGIDEAIKRKKASQKGSFELKLVQIGEGTRIIQCAHCLVGFHTMLMARSHYKELIRNKECSIVEKQTEKCKFCKIFISARSMKTHIARYHKKSSAKSFSILQFSNLRIKKPVKAIKVNVKAEGGIKERINSKSTIEAINTKERDSKILYQCKDCKNNYWHLQYFKTHLKQAKCTNKTVICEYCNLQFSFNGFLIHSKLYHAHGNFNKVHFNIKEFSRSDINELKDDNNDTKQDKLASVYKCTNCEVVFDEIHKNLHTKCSLKNTATEFCKVCNLTFYKYSMRIHDKLHLKYSQLDSSCFEIIDLQLENDKTVIYSCRECGVSFYDDTMASLHAKLHKTKATFKTSYECIRCNLSFGALTGEQHENHHKDVPDLDERSFEIIEFNSDDSVKELAKSRNSKAVKNIINEVEEIKAKEPEAKVLKTNNNIAKKSTTGMIHKVVRCVDCKKCCIPKDYKQHKCDDETETCTKCNLEFTNIANHKKAHSVSKTIRIYFVDFNPITKQLLEQNKTYEESYEQIEPKMTEKPSTKIFRCEICELDFISREGIETHMSECQKKRIPKCPCKCGLVFTKIDLEIHCTDFSASHSIDDFDIEIVPEGKNKTKSKAYSLWQCSKCNECADNKRSLRHHKFHCMKNDNSDKICHICDLTFIQKNIFENHVKLHKKVNVRKDDFVIIPFDTLSKDKEQFSKPTLYRCLECNGNFLNYEGLAKHLTPTHKSINNLIACDVCDLSFGYLTLGLHKDIHHIKNNFSINDITVLDYDKKMIKYNLFHCKQCDCYFLSHHAVQTHFNAHIEIETVPCEICNLKFAETYIPKHKKMHHTEKNITRESFKIISLDPNTEKAFKDKITFEDDSILLIVGNNDTYTNEIQSTCDGESILSDLPEHYDETSILSDLVTTRDNASMLGDLTSKPSTSRDININEPRIYSDSAATHNNTSILNDGSIIGKKSNRLSIVINSPKVCSVIDTETSILSDLNSNENDDIFILGDLIDERNVNVGASTSHQHLIKLSDASKHDITDAPEPCNDVMTIGDVTKNYGKKQRDASKTRLETGASKDDDLKNQSDVIASLDKEQCATTSQNIISIADTDEARNVGNKNDESALQSSKNVHHREILRRKPLVGPKSYKLRFERELIVVGNTPKEKMEVEKIVSETKSVENVVTEKIDETKKRQKKKHKDKKNKKKKQEPVETESIVDKMFEEELEVAKMAKEIMDVEKIRKSIRDKMIKQKTIDLDEQTVREKGKTSREKAGNRDGENMEIENIEVEKTSGNNDICIIVLDSDDERDPLAPDSSDISHTVDDLRPVVLRY